MSCLWRYLAISAEIQLEADLIALDGLETDRALETRTWPAPHSARPRVWKLACIEGGAGPDSQGILIVHLLAWLLVLNLGLLTGLNPRAGLPKY